MGALRFAKYEGLGNDFLVVDTKSEGEVSEASAAKLCDRRRGVGGDGVLLVLPPSSAASRARMRVINADGSVPEMCGNGLRCVALHLATGGAPPTEPTEFTVETDAGPKVCVVAPDGGGGAEITIDMGVVSVTGETSITIDDRTFAFVTADAGNPHAIYTGPFTRADAERFGHALATHPSFPRGSNIELVAQTSPTRAEVLVWERGVGITLACGTGACATARVLTSLGRSPFDEEITIELLGGPLAIRVARDGRVRMRGPARLAFEGVVNT